MKATFRLAGVFCTAVLLLAACGGGDGDADAELIAAVKASMDADTDAFDGMDFDSQCGAESFVEGLGGAEQAEEKYGVTVEVVEASSNFDIDLEQADAEAFVDGFWECGDLMAAMTEGMTDEGASEADATCLAENIDEDIFKQGLVAEFMGEAGNALSESNGDELFASIIDAMGTCNIDLDSFGS